MDMINTKNDQMYRLSTSGWSSFCNGHVLSVTKCARSVQRSGYDTRNFASVQAIRQYVAQYMGRAGWLLMSTTSAKEVDLMTKELSKRYHLYKVATSSAAMVVCANRERTKAIGLEDMAPRLQPTPTPHIYGEGEWKLSDRLEKNLEHDRKQYDTSGSRRRRAVSSGSGYKVGEYTDVRPMLKHIYEVINSATANITEYSVRMLRRYFRSVDENAAHQHSPIYCNSNAHAITDIGNLTSIAPRSITYLQPSNLLYTNSEAIRPLRTPLYYCADAETYWKWVYSAVHTSLVQNKHAMATITDNTHYQDNPNRTGALIAHFYELQASGVTQVATNTGEPLYFQVLPIIIGNYNHSDHDTICMVVSCEPITIENITRTRPARTRQRRVRAA